MQGMPSASYRDVLPACPANKNTDSKTPSIVQRFPKAPLHFHRCILDVRTHAEPHRATFARFVARPVVHHVCRLAGRRERHPAVVDHLGEAAYEMRIAAEALQVADLRGA